MRLQLACAFVSAAVAITVDQVTACESLVGYPNNEDWNEDCRAKCAYYAGEGKPWCPKVSTAQGLAECVVKFHPDQCQLLLDPLAECQQALGNPSNPDWDADCDVQCLHYFENGAPWCGDASVSGSKLIECVLHYQGDHCIDLRKPVRSAPVQSAPTKRSRSLSSATGSSNAEACKSLVESPHNEVWDADCRDKCSYYEGEGKPWCRKVLSPLDLATCVVTHHPDQCQLVTKTPLEICQSSVGNTANADWHQDCLDKCAYYLEEGAPWCADGATSGASLIACVLKYQGDHCSVL